VRRYALAVWPMLWPVLLVPGCPSRVIVDGPKTAQCPEGRYLVSADETKDPPEVSYKCQKPTSTASAAPEPSAAPSASPSATPPPTPSPTPSTAISPPSPASSPSASPSAQLPIPPEGVCPAGWPVKPDFVTIGEKPWRAPANPYAWIFNVTPRTNAPYCPHKPGATCEQWAPCAAQWRIAAKAWGPGFNGDEVERRSSNSNLLVMVLGEHGSPPGRYEVCVAPTEAEIRGPNGMCRFYDLTLP
jgi:hypothetical protein